MVAPLVVAAMEVVMTMAMARVGKFLRVVSRLIRGSEDEQAEIAANRRPDEAEPGPRGGRGDVEHARGEREHARAERGGEDGRTEQPHLRTIGTSAASVQATVRRRRLECAPRTVRTLTHAGCESCSLSLLRCSIARSTAPVKRRYTVGSPMKSTAVPTCQIWKVPRRRQRRRRSVLLLLWRTDRVIFPARDRLVKRTWYETSFAARRLRSNRTIT